MNRKGVEPPNASHLGISPQCFQTTSFMDLMLYVGPVWRTEVWKLVALSPRRRSLGFRIAGACLQRVTISQLSLACVNCSPNAERTHGSGIYLVMGKDQHSPQPPHDLHMQRRKTRRPSVRIYERWGHRLIFPPPKKKNQTVCLSVVTLLTPSTRNWKVSCLILDQKIIW